MRRVISIVAFCHSAELCPITATLMIYGHIRAWLNVAWNLG